jgi:uncharacterized DUF497 family protein
MEFEWDPAKAAANLKKHKVRFADAALSFEDSRALSMPDPDAIGEARYILLAADPAGRVLITVYTPRGRLTRIISSRKASASERLTYEEIS